jgi:NADH-quinone oxidoreductase subunit M
VIPWLLLLVLIPWAGALACRFAAGGAPGRAVAIARWWSLLPLLLVLGPLAAAFDFTRAGEVQLVERAAWMPSLGVGWFAGLDALGLLCVALTSLVVPMSLWAAAPDPRRLPWLLALQGALAGSFTALNFIHWFLFWELALIPAWFLVRIGGRPAAARAANGFFLYTMAGSVAMLAGMIAVHQATGSFDLLELAQNGGVDAALQNAHAPGSAWPAVVFFAVLAGVAVKIPLYPLHNWLPATYAESPPAVTMVLTGAMSKMGLYGLLRVVAPLFPAQIQAWSGLLLTLAVAGIVLSALAALAQSDLRRMLAYSSVNHLGYCLLAVFAAAGGAAPWTAMAYNGVLLQIFNHGIIAAALFGGLAMLEARAGCRATLDGFGGLRARLPQFSALLGIVWFASIGLPGLSGFVGEFLMFQGSFALAPAATAAAALGLLLTAVFLLRAWKHIFHGPLNPACAAWPDLTRRERLVLAAAVALIIIPGIFPNLLLSWLSLQFLHLS